MRKRRLDQEQPGFVLSFSCAGIVGRLRDIDWPESQMNSAPNQPRRFPAIHHARAPGMEKFRCACSFGPRYDAGFDKLRTKASRPIEINMKHVTPTGGKADASWNGSRPDALFAPQNAQSGDFNFGYRRFQRDHFPQISLKTAVELEDPRHSCSNNE